MRIVMIAMLALLATTAHAATWHVPSQVPTIAAGLAAASAGDTVRIACGTYFERNLTLKSGVVLSGDPADPSCVVIDAESRRRIAIGMRIQDAVVEGITFRNGFDRTGLDFGREAASGGPRAEALAPPDHDYGGGGALFLLHPDVTIRQCRFETNEAVVHGGALRLQGGTARLQDVVFAGNVAGNQGGGFYAADSALLVLDAVTAWGNHGGQGGAGFVSRSHLLCNASHFADNESEGSGGAVQITAGTAAFTQSTFLRNRADRWGGGVAFFPVTAARASYSGCTFVHNFASSGGCIAGPADVSASILAYGEGGAVDCRIPPVTLECCDVFGNVGGDFIDCLSGQEGANGNFSASPILCSPETGDLSLAAGSPCLPEGNSCGVQIGARGLGCGPVVPVTVETAPPGLRIVVDGTERVTPVTLEWREGAVHELAAPEGQSGDEGTRHGFESWSDGGTRVHEVTATTGTDLYIATYGTEHRLDLLADGQGTVLPGGAWHARDSIVEIQAIPEAGWEFARWVGEGEGAYTGPNAVANVTMTGPVVETAYFAEGGLFTLTMSAGAGGSVLPGTGQHPIGATVEIRAIPEPAWDFDRWIGTGAGAYSGTDAVREVVLFDDITEQAVFLRRQHPVTMITEGPGTVQPSSGSFPEGSTVAIQAVPDAFAVFLEWIGEGPGSYTGTSASASITIGGPITQTARFEGPPLHFLTMIADGPGTVSPPSGIQVQGSTVQIRATPTRGYQFQEWTGEGPGSYSGPSATASITIGGPITQTARFDGPPTYPLTMHASAGGQVTPAPGVHTYPNGAQVAIEAIADSGFAFRGWAGEGDGSYSGISAATTIGMYAPIVQMADFVPAVPCTLTMEAGPGGSVTPPTGVYAAGTVVTITAVPGPLFRFLRWVGSGDGNYSGPANPATVLLAGGNVTQYAEFGPRGGGIPVTVTTVPAGLDMVVDGVDCVSPQLFAWPPGSDHTLEVPVEALVAEGERFLFREWSDGIATPTRVEVARWDRTYYGAGYDHQYLLHLPVVGEGSTVPADTWVAAGSTIPIEAVPGLNHAFSGWAGEGDGSYTGPATRADVTMNGPLIQTAAFEPLGFEFSISSSPTDPWRNVDTATGGPRELHLWLTCADHGISALEASVQSHAGVQIFGFQPGAGVLNAGNATDLLLAISGCPGGEALPIPLGKWVVLDEGGSVCLGAGATVGYAATECDPLHPGVAEDPVVIGFVSAGSTPCTNGTHGCASGGVASRMAALRAGWVAAAPGIIADALAVTPNPFRGTAEIRLALTAEASVRLDVFDVTGRLVRRIVDERLPGGVLMRPWDSRDASGRTAPAGIYFVRVDTSTGFHAVRKLVFLGAR